MRGGRYAYRAREGRGSSHGTGVPGHGTGLSETADPVAAGKIGEAEEHPTGGAWHESLPKETSAVGGRDPEPRVQSSAGRQVLCAEVDRPVDERAPAR